MFIVVWASMPIMVFGSLSQAGVGYVGIYTDSLGTAPCATVLPLNGTTLYVIAKTAGGSADGITGAEFRIEVTNPDGWIFTYTPPGVTNLIIGNPIDTDPDPSAGGGMTLAFSNCQVPSNGMVGLGTLSVFNTSGGVTDLLVKRHSQPTNSGYPCALLLKCDAPYYTKVCMTAAPPDSCTLRTQKTSLVAVEDPEYFVASLNRDVAQDPDPEPDTGPQIPADAPQVLAMFKAGVVSFPPGETRASLARATIRSAPLRTVLANHNVQVIARAFPHFNLADTLGTSRTGESVRFMNYSTIYRLSLPTSGDPQLADLGGRGRPASGADADERGPLRAP
jgi:hypothetical protein